LPTLKANLFQINPLKTTSKPPQAEGILADTSRYQVEPCEHSVVGLMTFCSGPIRASGQNELRLPRLLRTSMNISVAMCTFNGALYLEEQLKSIEAQIRPPDEVIICDDRSIDETRRLLERFRARTRIPVHLHFNKENLASNRNFEQAIGFCQGEVIALCDQDDIWHPTKLAVMESVFRSRPEVALVFSNGKVINEKSETANYTLWEGVQFDARLQEKILSGQAFAALEERPSVTGTAMAFRAAFKSLVLPMPHDIGFVHDEWISLLIAARAELVMIDKPLIKYRFHPQQQIGLNLPSKNVEHGSLTLLREALQRENPYRAKILKLRAVENRLASQLDSVACQNAYRLVREKSRHLKVRGELKTRRLGSMTCIARELLSFRYHRYSRGFFSALKDLEFLIHGKASLEPFEDAVSFEPINDPQTG
jgi:glycosyltransferase involved in cell wall biosynthesis